MAHRHALTATLCAVDPDNLYSLGQPRRRDGRPQTCRNSCIYVRPRGQLFHVAQVGGMFLAANAPPHINRAQQDYVSAFVKAMAAVSGQPHSRARVFRRRRVAGVL